MFLIIVYGKILLLFQEKALKWKNFMFVVPISPKRGYTIENDNKTDRRVFVGGINCSAQNAYTEMIAVRLRFGMKGKVVA